MLMALFQLAFARAQENVERVGPFLLTTNQVSNLRAKRPKTQIKHSGAHDLTSQRSRCSASSPPGFRSCKRMDPSTVDGNDTVMTCNMPSPRPSCVSQSCRPALSAANHG